VGALPRGLYLTGQRRTVDCWRMLAARKIALRVNGVRITAARIRRGGSGLELIIADPLVDDFAVDERFSLEVLELLVPPKIRQRLPNGGWRRVSLRILLALLGSGAVEVVQEEKNIS